MSRSGGTTITFRTHHSPNGHANAVSANASSKWMRKAAAHHAARSSWSPPPTAYA